MSTTEPIDPSDTLLARAQEFRQYLGDACGPYEDIMDAFEDIMGEAMARDKAALRHTHQAGEGDDLDTCRKCGLNIRNEIHLRWGEKA